MTRPGPRWAVCQRLPMYFHAFLSFDGGTVGDHFRVAVAIKALETDLSYLALGLSEHSGMTSVATSSCQPVVAIA